MSEGNVKTVDDAVGNGEGGGGWNCLGWKTSTGVIDAGRVHSEDRSRRKRTGSPADCGGDARGVAENNVVWKNGGRRGSREHFDPGPNVT